MRIMSSPSWGGRIVWIMPGVVCVIAAIAGMVWYALAREPTSRELLQAAEHALRSGRAAEAEQLAERVLADPACLADPTCRADAVLLAAQSAIRQEAWERSQDYLQRVQHDFSPQNLAAHLLRARLLRERLLQLREAEQAYRLVLQIDSAHLAANEELARLLASCGRRSEAIPHILRVLQADDSDLLVLLARSSGLIHQPDLLQKCRQAAPQDPLPVFGLAQYAVAAGNTGEAIALLRESLAVDPQFLPAWAVLGEQLAAAYDPAALAEWAAQVPAAAESFAATWQARGDLAEQSGQTEAAIRCYWEALRREPESRPATFRLSQLLTRAGAGEAARFEERLQVLDRLSAAQDRALFSGQPAGMAELLELIRCCQDAGRIWEAFAWARVANEVDPQSPPLQTLWAELAQQTAGLPLELTAPQFSPARTVDFSSYPLPRIPGEPGSSVTEPEKATAAVRFRAETAEVGFDFAFHNGTTDPPALRMYEFTGGGIGAIDVDLDGFPDVVCTQGGEGPRPDSAEDAGDQLFRNLGGSRFADVTAWARIQDRRFGQGVAVGDFDNDGFADFYVANIGTNQLWRNNGDGTFDALAVPGGSDDTWTTSCAMVDLNGDSLPDLYDVNYLTGEDVFERTCRNPDGSTAMCMPFDFDGEVDRLLLNDGTGGFADVTATAFSSSPDGKGLGIVAWDEDEDGRPVVLVANDTTPNALLRRGEDGPRFLLEDRGIASGIGLNRDGKAEGCMGIALGDVDGDGRLDVHITNFLAESNTLYTAEPDGGFFTDRTREVGLHEPSWNVLGFGTQFLDADLDGRLELFVSNGHLQDLRRFGRPYRMPAQLFAIAAGRAAQVPAESLGPYFEQQWLGRPVARIDWNRDGREDLLVGHLEDPTVLLTNVSPTPGNALTLRLVGTASPRDGTGATVRIRVGDSRQVRQITAGDGYQASNEKRIVFGVGEAETIDEILVKWPAGGRHEFTGVRAGQRLILVEGRGALHTAP